MEKLDGSVVFNNSGHIFYIASEAYGRISDASDRAWGQPDALISIVFACASLEGFINELAELAAQPASYGRPANPASITEFALLSNEVEAGRGSLGLKYQLAYKMFSGKTYRKGEYPFQDFALLIAIRNDLVHLRPKEGLIVEKGVEVRVPKVVEKLRSKNILAELPDRDAEVLVSTWVNLVSTRAIARWACNTASAMVQSVLEAVPESDYKEKLNMFYVYSFKSVAE